MSWELAPWFLLGWGFGIAFMIAARILYIRYAGWRYRRMLNRQIEKTRALYPPHSDVGAIYCWTPPRRKRELHSVAKSNAEIVRLTPQGPEAA